MFTKIGWVWVNPYMTLVLAYERMIGARGTEIKPGDPVPPVPDKAAGDRAHEPQPVALGVPPPQLKPRAQVEHVRQIQRMKKKAHRRPSLRTATRSIADPPRLTA